MEYFKPAAQSVELSFGSQPSPKRPLVDGNEAQAQRWARRKPKARAKAK